MAVVLCYNLPPEKKIKLLLICEKLRLPVRQITKEQYALPIGALCGMLETRQDDSDPVEDFDDEMLVFCDFDSRLLDIFLQEMRTVHMQPVYLKAVVTPSNMHWSGSRLCRELRREREAIGRSGKANHRPVK